MNVQDSSTTGKAGGGSDLAITTDPLASDVSEVQQACQNGAPSGTAAGSGKQSPSGPPNLKKVKIMDLGPSHDAESDEEDSVSQAAILEPTISALSGENAVPATQGGGGASGSQTADSSAAERKKTKEERKKEREKKKEEEMLKKYQAEQEAKQRVSAKSKCGRWIKHNLKIGEGGYKFVYRGYDTVEARNVAWCEFRREQVDTKEKRQAMFKETEIMLKMTHPHIVRCFAVFRDWTDMEDPNNQIEEKGVVIVQELMGEGTLKSIIRKNFLDGECILKFPLITRWWHQILDALRYMHHKIEPPILHRDLKSDNCFLYGASDEEYLNVKVGDFGLATHVNNSGRKTMLGTLGFMAPEIFDEKYDEKVDIYAFGMLMLEVMTNRTPYDECETVMQVAAKTMSGKGPDNMDKVLSPSLREVISACIHPMTCYRPSAEELYFHPLFQPKTLPVEVEPNYDNTADRAEVLDRFVRSLDNLEGRNPNFNLRLRFRDKKMLQELGLDDGESLEFDLDIYKAEDQDIPELIQNLRSGYEDKLSRVFENPKQPDKKIVSSHLDKLFSSIRLQMQFLVKVLLGKRWRAILDSLVDDEHRVRRKVDVSAPANEDDSDTEAFDTSSFTMIGQYKGKWNRAKRMLDKEIQAYRNRTATASPSLSAPATTTDGVSTVMNGLDAPINVPTGAATTQSATSKVSTTQPPTSMESVPSSTSVANSGVPIVTTVGKFTVTSTVPSPGIPNAPSTMSVDSVPEYPKSTAEQHTAGQPSQPTAPSTLSQSASILHNAPPYSTQDSIPGTARYPVDLTTPPLTYPHIVPPTGLPSMAANLSSSALESSPSVIQGAADTPAPSPATIGDVVRSAKLLQGLLQGIAGNTAPTMSPPQSNIANVSPLATIQHSPSPLLLQPLQQQPQQQYLLAPNTAPAGAPEQMINPITTAPSSSLMNFPCATQSNLPVVMGTSSEPFAPSHIIQSIGQPIQSPLPPTTFAQPAQDQSAPMLSTAFLPVSIQSVWKYNTSPEFYAQQQQQLDSEHASKADSAVLLTQLIGALSGNVGPQTQQLLNQALAISQSQQPPMVAQTYAPPPQKITDRKPRKKSKPKPRYVLRVVKIDRDGEGAEPNVGIRPTFYLEMPDLNNPNSEVWKLSFRCNLSDTLDDIKLFQGSSYKPADEEIERAATEAVIQMLEALRTDVNSIRLNQDYVFYPRHTVQPLQVLPMEMPVASGKPTVQSMQVGGSLQTSGSLLPSSQPSAGTRLLYDGGIVNAPMANLEEILPVERQMTSVDVASAYLRTYSMEDEEDVGEISRSMSPTDGMITTSFPPFSAVIPTQSHEQVTQPVMVLNPNASGVSTSAYLTAPSAATSLSLNPNVVQGLISSLASKLSDPGSFYTSIHAGLEEVAPLLAAGGAIPSSLPSTVPSITPLAPTDPLNVNQLETEPPLVHNVDSTSFLLSQFSQASLNSHVPAPCNPLPSTDCHSTVNLNMTVPAYLESTIRDLAYHLCSAPPSQPYIILPSPIGSSDTSSHIIELPHGHIFLGVPNPTDPHNLFRFSTFRLPHEAFFIMLDSPQQNTEPRVYTNPIDSAVVLTPDGTVYNIDKTALVVPPQHREHRANSPPGSPDSDTTEAAAKLAVGSTVQVKELPLPSNTDTLTLDDVLNLLLTLRSTTPFRSSAVSPTVDAPHVQPTEMRSLSALQSRRSSAVGVNMIPTQTYSHTLSHPNVLSQQIFTGHRTASSGLRSQGPNANLSRTDATQFATNAPSQHTTPSIPPVVAVTQANLKPSTERSVFPSSNLQQPANVGVPRKACTINEHTQFYLNNIQQNLQLLSSINSQNACEQVTNALLHLICNSGLVQNNAATIPIQKTYYQSSQCQSCEPRPVLPTAMQPLNVATTALQQSTSTTGPANLTSALPALLNRLLTPSTGADTLPKVIPVSTQPPVVAVQSNRPAPPQVSLPVLDNGVTYSAAPVPVQQQQQPVIQPKSIQRPPIEAHTQQNLSISTYQQAAQELLNAWRMLKQRQQPFIQPTNPSPPQAQSSNQPPLPTPVMQTQPQQQQVIADTTPTRDQPVGANLDALNRLLTLLQTQPALGSALLSGNTAAPLFHHYSQPQITQPPSSSTLPTPVNILPANQPVGSCASPGQPFVHPTATTAIPNIPPPASTRVASDSRKLNRVELAPSNEPNRSVIGPKTVANKFTVVPVQSESDEPAPPPARSHQSQSQVPPRPPRQKPTSALTNIPPVSISSSQVSTADMNNNNNMIVATGTPIPVSGMITPTPQLTGSITPVPTCNANVSASYYTNEASRIQATAVTQAVKTTSTPRAAAPTKTSSSVHVVSSMGTVASILPATVSSTANVMTPPNHPHTGSGS